MSVNDTHISTAFTVSESIAYHDDFDEKLS